MYHYDYNSFNNDVNTLIKHTKPFRPEIILAVARGGVTLGHFLAERLKLRRLYTLNSIHYDDQQKLDTIEVFNIPDLGENRRVLIVDDIVDSGESMAEIVRVLKERFPKNDYKTASLFYKKEAIFQPDFSCHEAKEWIEFFWSA
jgi:xanthine phosphoribosyltransferase